MTDTCTYCLLLKKENKNWNIGITMHVQLSTPSKLKPSIVTLNFLKNPVYLAHNTILLTLEKGLSHTYLVTTKWSQ